MRATVVTTAVALTLALTACSSSSADSAKSTSDAATSSSTTATGAAAAAASSSAQATAESSTPTSPSSSTAASAGTVSANDASMDELTAAFTAAGVTNPDRWAREVDEYRPYDATDTGFNKLRKELAKYNPAAGVVDKIVATLAL